MLSTKPNISTQQQMVVISGSMPVELISFQAEKVEATVRLNWATANEINSQGFEIQRSPDALHWEVLGFVDSKGQSNSTQNYAYIDQRPIKGINYYRLLQKDWDGRSDYTSIVEVNFDLLDYPISVFPNPSANGQFTVAVSPQLVQAGKAQLRVFDQLGRQLYEQPVDRTLMELNIESLPSGNYTIHVSDGLQHAQVRLIVTRD
ncbi:MAG: T9SS type A sorting domain-containing protein [Bacteroidota bacterium]